MMTNLLAAATAIPAAVMLAISSHSHGASWGELILLGLCAAGGGANAILLILYPTRG